MPPLWLPSCRSFATSSSSLQGARHPSEEQDLPPGAAGGTFWLGTDTTGALAPSRVIPPFYFISLNAFHKKNKK